MTKMNPKVSVQVIVDLFGRYVSLTTEVGAQYVGILAHYSPIDYSIRLSQVRSIGEEDMGEVHESLQFQGSEIVDLQPIQNKTYFPGRLDYTNFGTSIHNQAEESRVIKGLSEETSEQEIVLKFGSFDPIRVKPKSKISVPSSGSNTNIKPSTGTFFPIAPKFSPPEKPIFATIPTPVSPFGISHRYTSIYKPSTNAPEKSSLPKEYVSNSIPSKLNVAAAPFYGRNVRYHPARGGQLSQGSDVEKKDNAKKSEGLAQRKGALKDGASSTYHRQGNVQGTEKELHKATISAEGTKGDSASGTGTSDATFQQSVANPSGRRRDYGGRGRDSQEAKWPIVPHSSPSAGKMNEA